MAKQTIPFIGRTHELTQLSGLTRKKAASLVVIRGRRRIGKSRLVEEFAKKHPDYTFYSFAGIAPIETHNIAAQKQDFIAQMHRQNIACIKSDDWGDLFYQLSQATNTGPHIILLDEVSWLAAQDTAFLPKLKQAWDQYFSKNPQIILILCGSVSSWIEKNILSSTAFFGRIALKITLRELSLFEANELLNTLGFRRSAYEKLILLSVMGAIPWYLENINPHNAATQNISTLCFTENGLLFDEFQHIFHDLFGSRGPIYQKIVQALAEGSRTMEMLAQDIDYAIGGPLSEYLHDLEVSGFIMRDYNWNISTQKISKQSQYRLSDNYLRFYVKYIKDIKEKIKTTPHFQQNIDELPHSQTIFGLQFENLILNNRGLIFAALNIAPRDIVMSNPYFQKPTKRHKGCQIDFLIQTRLKTLYVCEIKFSRRTIGSYVIADVQEKIARLNIPRGFAIVPILVHATDISEDVLDAGYFYNIINIADYIHSTTHT